MSIIAVIASVIKLIIMMMTNHYEQNKRKQVKKQEIINDIQKAIKDRDVSAITLGFDRAHRL